MGVRKNAKFLTPVERENFVKSCVLMKSDIVNPAASPARQYSKWDEYTAIHWMIQGARPPGGGNINYGHGGRGSYGFLSWHRYFLYQFEKDLQGYVPGVMLPYWDWQNPATIMSDTFLGPDGGVGNVVQRGYFAVDRPGVGANTTPLPIWWPATLGGWRMPDMFPLSFHGGLQRILQPLSDLPSTLDISGGLAIGNLPDFQAYFEGGPGIGTNNQMHNQMHGWINGHMRNPTVSPHDPFFYLTHCNIDRLWAMWQADGHASDFPTSGGVNQHHRNDLIYPWVGSAAGYSNNIASINTAIPMPNYSAVGAIRNVDTLDHRAAFGYTYDTLPIVGLSLDRTGSMNGMTPDPMTTSSPDVTKWEAAKRGIAAFLQDCETVQASGRVYVLAGAKTFRRWIGGNDFTPIFSGSNFGLVKTGGTVSQSVFNSNIAAMTPGGGTPLGDALSDMQNTVVEPPFAGLPADETRYLAMLTDGILTSGSPLSSIPDGSFSRTGVLAMGFGTGADVDYPTLATMVAKGKTLPIPTQVFHGETAGAIDKFYGNALEAAIGFSPVTDPVIELFAGEHTHLPFYATSADDTFLITAQGMDFRDENWDFSLHGPGGQVLYGDGHGQGHSACNHCCPPPTVTAKRANGRLSIILQRGNTSKDCWVGKWELMVSYKAKTLDKMMMPDFGSLLFPVTAGSIRGAKFANLLISPKARIATRNIATQGLHGLDTMPVSTNSNEEKACNVVVNVSAKTNLNVHLKLEKAVFKKGDHLKLLIQQDAQIGSLQTLRSFSRLVSPLIDLNSLFPNSTAQKRVAKLEAAKSFRPALDTALKLAKLEKDKKFTTFIKDAELPIVSHNHGALHAHLDDTETPGTYHFGVYVEGIYLPDVTTHNSGHDHAASVDTTNGEYFTRILNITTAVL